MKEWYCEQIAVLITVTLTVVTWGYLLFELSSKLRYPTII